ncbi:hypothetical protein [Bradyrhizobium cosmicum]|uniref:Uncharacterized protein n=1 Tax=Bradyrhizobium cosmicum TaxID=1404864 RepID=A0AAI8QCV7_9BRAD|nr:hypothetical protein [Bradyrhizobium cosmicum]BAL77033.1 hypothetical protein S23_38380 [Bradyrhizobium cosmicum]
MAQVIDEADYRRRLDALDSSNISLGDEVSDIGAGWSGLLDPSQFGSDNIGTGPLNARKNILQAKQEALRHARKELIKAIRAADDAQRAASLLPIEVEQIVTGSSDELIKV